MLITGTGSSEERAARQRRIAKRYERGDPIAEIAADTNAARAATIMLDSSPVSLRRKRKTLSELSSYVAKPSRFGERPEN